MNISFGSSYAALRFAGNQAQKPAEQTGQKQQAAQQQPAQPPQEQAVNG